LTDMKSDWENQLQRSAGKFRPIYIAARR